jgi:hypothetical protein
MSSIKLSGSSGSGFDLPPEGTRLAWIVAAVAVGEHESKLLRSSEGEPNGDGSRWSRRLFVVFELVKGGALVSADLTLTWNERGNLRKLAGAARGRPYTDHETFDPEELLGRHLLVTIEHRTTAGGDRKYPRVTSYAPAPEEMAPAGSPKHGPLWWELGQPLDILRANEWLPYRFGEPLIDAVRAARDYAKAYPILAPADADPF